ncbi:MarR family transcriptional regulator [Paenibacillus sp. P25]|nr:MarR family transcriptional regulator [Paenibacillus sp. P25]
MPNRTDLLELEETFRQLFRKAKACWNTFEAEGLTASQALMLQKLDEEGPLKASQLADALWITAGAVTSFSDKLISGGYARRSRPRRTGASFTWRLRTKAAICSV